MRLRPTKSRGRSARSPRRGVPGRPGDILNPSGASGPGSLAGEVKTAASGAAHDHSHCLMCGESNPYSLRLSFQPDGHGGVNARFKASSRLQGHIGSIHDGITAALLDSAMTHCLFQQGIKAVTADLRVRYAQLIPSDARLEIRAVITGRRPPLYDLRAEVTLGGRLMAWSEAKFIECRAGA